jgi:PLP dependent protein
VSADRRREIAARADEVRGRIAEACQRSGRPDGSVLLVTVSKTFPASDVSFAAEAGLRVFGENRVQEGAAKKAELADAGLAWHLIGPLQSNKAKAALLAFDVIQAVASLPLAERLDRIAGEESRPQVDLLLEVNLGRESTKAGFAPEETARAAASVARLGRVNLRGLMAIPPHSDDPEAVRPHAAALRDLLEECRAGLPESARGAFRELSIGMSGDYEAAILEGATIVRVGSAIFGSRA